MNAQDLYDKIEWEGGVLEAIEYGIKPDDISVEEIADKWYELRDQALIFMRMEEDFMKYLRNRSDVDDY